MIDNGERLAVVIPAIDFVGEGGRRDGRLAVQLGAIGILARGKPATVAGEATTIASAERIAAMPGWWELETA